MKQRRTVQLAAVFRAVRTAHDHPTADEIHQRVRRGLPRISLGTVYRNLQKQDQQQRVRSLHLSGRAVRYDVIAEDHDHFVCESCGQLTDLARRGRGRPRWRPAAGFAVRACTMTLYGVCPSCNREASES
jgi:Fe2+ or Zn2+ uptake regulation protein